MRARIGIVIAVFVVGAIGAIIWASLGLGGFTAEVCITYKGRTECRVASGNSREQAIDTARTMACATISSGVGETIACGNTEPDSVRWVDQ